MHAAGRWLFTPLTRYYREAFRWHGVQRGEAHQFHRGDITTEGPHPLRPSGGNTGEGRTRTSLFTNSIEQLQGRAGRRLLRHAQQLRLHGVRRRSGLAALAVRSIATRSSPAGDLPRCFVSASVGIPP